MEVRVLAVTITDRVETGLTLALAGCPAERRDLS